MQFPRRVSSFQYFVLSRFLSTINNPRPFREIPRPKWSLPYFGTVFHYRLGIFSIPDRRTTLLQFREQYGPIVRETMHGHTVVHLFDPDDYQQIYSSEGKMPMILPLLDAIVHYRKQKGYAPGVGNINGDEWYRVRAAVRRLMMMPMSVAAFINKEQEVANEFVDRLKSIRNPSTGLIDNLELEIRKWNYETAGNVVFDRRFGILNTGEDDTPMKMVKINEELFEKSVKLRFSMFPFYKYVRTPLWRKLEAEEDLFYRHVISLLNSAVVECRQFMESEDEQENSDRFFFLKSLLHRDEMTMLDCHAVCQSLFTDGFTTTVPTTIGQLYCLATNPEKQELLYKEICDVIGPKEDSVTSKHLNEMPYLRSCVKEGFRFFPIGLEVSRITPKDLILSGYEVPEGTAVELNNFASLQDEKYFSNAQTYLPERWLRDNVDAIVHAFAHMPFSHGPRQCLGRRFAEQEMYLLLIKIVQRFRLEWRGERPMRQRWRLLNVPDVRAKIALLDR